MGANCGCQSSEVILKFLFLALFQFAIFSPAALSHPALTDPSVKQIAGPKISADSDGPVLIQFWASWCGRCSTMFGELDALARDHSGLQFLTVSIDDDAKAALTYLEDRSEDLAHITALHDSKGTLAKKYEVSSVPLVLLVGPNGKVLFRMDGHPTNGKLFQLSKTMKATGGKL